MAVVEQCWKREGNTKSGSFGGSSRGYSGSGGKGKYFPAEVIHMNVPCCAPSTADQLSGTLLRDAEDGLLQNWRRVLSQGVQRHRTTVKATARPACCISFDTTPAPKCRRQ